MTARAKAPKGAPSLGPTSSGTHAIDLSERRRLSRAAVAQIVRVRWGDRLFEGQVRDVGIGGMFVVAAVQPSYGATITIEMGSPLGALTLPGIVRWAEASGFGVQFTLLGARETKAISDMLAQSKREG